MYYDLFGLQSPGAEIAESPSGDIGIGIGGGGRLCLVGIGVLYQGGQIAIYGRVDTGHSQQEVVAYVQVAAVVVDGLVDIFSVGEAVVKDEVFVTGDAINGLCEQVIVVQAGRVLEIWDGLDIGFPQPALIRESYRIEWYGEGHG